MSDKSQVVPMAGHQESRSPECNENNIKTLFDENLGFVTENTDLSNLPCDSPVNMNDPIEYLRVVDLILASGLPNYKSVRIPLPSGFNWDYIEQQIQDYHDKIILDYIKFGFH